MEYSKGRTAWILRETGKCSVLAQIGLVSTYTLAGLQPWVTVVNIRYDAEQHPDLGVGWNCMRPIPQRTPFKRKTQLYIACSFMLSDTRFGFT